MSRKNLKHPVDTSEKNYNEFCESKNCPHFFRWYFMKKEMTSCKLLGESDNITHYPVFCPHKKEIARFVK